LQKGKMSKIRKNKKLKAMRNSNLGINPRKNYLDTHILPKKIK
jgi:hypothetical protein